MTSGTTALVVLALLVLGGPIIHGFALVLFAGIIVGTCSSIYVASAAAPMLGISRKDLAVARKEEGEGLDARP